MENTHHIYFSSGDSRATFPDNSPSSFRCLLPERLQLIGGNWWCALLELRLPETPSDLLYLCSDICHESIAGQFKLPVLALIGAQLTQPNHMIYIPLKTTDLSVIRFYLSDRFGNPISFSSGTSYCTIRICNDEALRYYT